MEGLFPDEWIIEANSLHANWFSDFSVDASGELQPFSIKDDHKRQFLNSMVAKTDAEKTLDWAARWLNVLKVIEDGLSSEAKRIYGSDFSLPEIDDKDISNTFNDNLPDLVLPIWCQRVYDAIDIMGGEAEIEEIYSYIDNNNIDLIPTWHETVRRTLGDHCIGSSHYKGLHVFDNVSPGRWKLAQFDTQ